MKTNLPSSREYAQFVTELKQRIASARPSAARAVNRDLILIYWDIGKGIVERQEKLGWGKSIVEHLARDLQAEFAGIEGFSARNLWYMRNFYAENTAPKILQQLVAELAEPGTPPPSEPDLRAKLQQLVAEIPWGHHVLILNKIQEPRVRLYYLRATAKLGWSRNMLLNQIKAKAYERSLAEGKTHNFPAVLPEYLAEQAEEALKSSYNLEFLGIRREVKERELEDRLIARLQNFILELGYGFCFIGRQHRVTLGKKEERLGSNLDLGTYRREILKSLSSLRLSLDLFPDRFAIAAHQPLIQTSKPLTDHPLLKPAVSMQ